MPGVREITAPVEFEVVADRLRFTLVSGEDRETYTMGFYLTRLACRDALALLDAQDRAMARRVRRFAGGRH